MNSIEQLFRRLRTTPQGSPGRRAFLPFLTAGAKDSDTPAVFVDASWLGFHDTEGEALFDADGKPAPVLQRALEFLRQFDFEQQRTRQFCQRLLELDVLKDMTLNATLPSGETIAGAITAC